MALPPKSDAPSMKRKSNVPSFVCMGCGRAFPDHMKALRIKDAGAVDFDNRQFYSVEWWFCPACMKTRIDWFTQGIRAAVERETQEVQKVFEIDLQKSFDRIPDRAPGKTTSDEIPDEFGVFTA